MSLQLIRVGVIGLLFVIAGCASQHKFPEPKELEPMVDFWEKVYSKWDTNEAVYHDNRYLDVVYKVVPVPAGVPNQRAYFLNYEEMLTDRLAEMALRYQMRQPLDAEQKRWADMLKKAGGDQAVITAPERVRYQRGLKSRFRRGLEISGYYVPEFKKIMKNHDVPEEIAYLPHVESSFQGSAKSSVGATGMWQFMPATARIYMPMQRNVIDARLDPFMAATGAAKYMTDAHNSLQSWPYAVTSYNHGIGGMNQAKKQFNEDFGNMVWKYDGRLFGFASRNFYAEFLAAKNIAENTQRYFPNVRLQAPRKADAIMLFEPMKVRELAGILGMSEITLVEMNPSWLRLIQTNQVGILPNIPVWIPQGFAKKVPSNIAKEYIKR